MCQDLEKVKKSKMIFYSTVFAIYGLIADYIGCIMLCIKGEYFRCIRMIYMLQAVCHSKLMTTIYFALINSKTEQ